MPLPQVFNRQTGEQVDAPLDQLHQGLINGTLALDAKGSPITLVGQDNKTYQASPDKVANALATGQYRLQTDDEALKSRITKEEEAKGTMGSLGSGLESAVNQASFGLEGAIRNAGKTPDELKEQELRDEYHKTARILGGTVGVGSTLLAGGELFKGLDLAGQAVERALVPAAEVANASLGTRLAGQAVNLAAQGAIMSSPQALVQAVAGNPKQAAETLAWGIGMGAILGTASEGASSLAESAFDSVKEAAVNATTLPVEGPIQEGAQDLGRYWKPEIAEQLKKHSIERGLKAVGAERSILNKMSQEDIEGLGNFLHEEGIIQPGKSRQDLGASIEALHDKYGAQLGDTIDKLDSFIKRSGSYDVSSLAIKPGELGGELRQALDGPDMRMGMNKDLANALDTIVKDADNLPTTNINGNDVITFNNAQHFVSGLRRRWTKAIDNAQAEGGVKGIQAVTPLDSLKSAGYQVLRNKLSTVADQVAEASDNPDLIGSLTTLKTKYAKLSQLEKFANTLDRQEAGNRLVGLTDFLNMGHGPFSTALKAAGAATGGAIGHFPGAMVGSTLGQAAGYPLDLMFKHWVEDKGLVLGSSVLRKALNDGPEVFSAVLTAEAKERLNSTLGTIKQTLQRMAQDEIASPPDNNPFHTLTSSKGNTDSLKKLQDRLQTFTANPQALIKATANISSPLDTVSPPLADAYRAQMTKAITYLYQSLPKPITPPPLFSNQKFIPTQSQNLAFKDKAEIVANPFAAISHMHSGTLSKDHLDALQQVYPELYNAFQQEILKYKASHPNFVLPPKQQGYVQSFLSATPNVSLVSSLSSPQPTQAPSKPQSISTKDRNNLSSSFDFTRGDGDPTERE